MEELVALAKLNKRTVDALAAPATGQAFLWDTEIKGFGVRVGATGQRRCEPLTYRRVSSACRQRSCLRSDAAVDPMWRVSTTGLVALGIAGFPPKTLRHQHPILIRIA